MEEEGSCICPSQNYTCQATSIIRMWWESESVISDPLQYTLLDEENLRRMEVVLTSDGFKVKFSRWLI